jgi:hypothetical protein
MRLRAIEEDRILTFWLPNARFRLLFDFGEARYSCHTIDAS